MEKIWEFFHVEIQEKTKGSGENSTAVIRPVEVRGMAR